METTSVGRIIKVNTIKYLPLQNKEKPFLYLENWYNRNELNKMGLSHWAKESILK